MDYMSGMATTKGDMMMDMNDTDDMDMTHYNMMNGAFYFADKVKPLLFKGLNITSVGGLIAVCIVLAILAVMYEVIKVFREYLFLQASTTCCQPMPGELTRLWPCSGNMSQAKRIQVHVGQTALHLLQVFLGYIIMLCMMSYNAWIFIAVIIALGLGYFLFGAVIPKQFQDMSDSPSCDINTREPRSYSSTSVSTVSHMVQD